MTRIVLIGEAMLELSHHEDGKASLRFGGDTLNTALYLARLGCCPHYVTALGNDPYSATMLREWEGEGVQVEHVLRHATRLPGLYAVQTDHSGERRFFYWRERSAARAFFGLSGATKALGFAAGAEWLYLSGITLSIFSAEERGTLVHLAERVRSAGGKVVFDPNYRPQGWASADEAREAMAAIAPHVSIALPTIDDEHALYGQVSAETHANRWEASDLVVLKCGAQGAILYSADGHEERVPVQGQIKPADTTGAGDSFNAGFLAGLLSGLSPVEAIRIGNRLAGAVIQHPGAIIPRDAMPASGVGK